MTPYSNTQDPQDIAISKFAFDLFINIANNASNGASFDIDAIEKILTDFPDIKLKPVDLLPRLTGSLGIGANNRSDVLMPFFAVCEIDRSNNTAKVMLNDYMLASYRAYMKENQSENFLKNIPASAFGQKH